MSASQACVLPTIHIVPSICPAFANDFLIDDLKRKDRITISSVPDHTAIHMPSNRIPENITALFNVNVAL